MGVLDSVIDLMRTPAEKKRRDESRRAADAEAAAHLLVAGDPAAAPAPDAREKERAKERRTRQKAAQRKARFAKAPTRGKAASAAPAQLTAGAPSTLVVRAPDGLVAGHPWQPLRPEALLPRLAAATQPAARLFVDESGSLLRYIQPVYAREDRLRYEVDDRFRTTLVVRDWPRDSASPRMWARFFLDLARDKVPELDISLHHWRIGATAATAELKMQIDKRQLELDELVASHGREDMRVIKLEESVAAMRENLQGLVRSLETLFHVSCYLRVGGDSIEQLRERVHEIEEAARSSNLTLTTAPGEQRDAYLSSMPFASDPAYHTKLRSSVAAAVLLPLVSRPHTEQNRNGKNPVVLYGLHMANDTPALMSPWNSNETIEITTVLGRMGSGKSYWLRCHLGRLAMVGIQTITIDPLGDFVKWHTQNDATIIEIAPGSPYHVNPFKRATDAEGNLEPVEQKVERLMPMFRLILGAEWDVIAQGLLEGGLREFFHRFGGEERLMRDFLDVLREFNRSSAGTLAAETLSRRERLVDTLALKCIDGNLRPFFEHTTNIDLDPRNPASRRVLFNLKPSGEGDLMVFASYMAITMAANIAQGSMDRKILLIDELHMLFRAQEAASGIGDFLRAFVRIHRHWNCALTFATQFVDEERTNTAQESILKATGTWVLLRGTERMLEQSARLIGKDADPELLSDLLRVSSASIEERRHDAKPMVIYRNGEPVPLWSVGLPFEDAEDDKSSGVRETGFSG